MTLTEMQTCAADTLSFFLEVMPDAPFSKDDIIFEFASRKDMAERAKALCAQYCSEKIINDSQSHQLNVDVAANALIGRQKSAVIAWKNHRLGKMDWRRIIFHELVHIYCAKMEMDGEHFIDIYGSGHTYDVEPENETYDGTLNAGYVVWSEFIAHYYSIKYTERAYRFVEVSDYAFGLLEEVNTADIIGSKAAFSMAASCLLASRDATDMLRDLEETDDIDSDESTHGKQARISLHTCLALLHKQLQTDKPWKISEDYISGLGGAYISFVMFNSLYHGNHTDAKLANVEEL